MNTIKAIVTYSPSLNAARDSNPMIDTVSGPEALRSEGVVSLRDLELHHLFRAANFGNTSTGYLAIALADEVLRLQNIIAEARSVMGAA